MRKAFTPTSNLIKINDRLKKREYLVSGFTLIELVVVIGIIAMLTAVSIVAIVGARSQRRADVAAEEVKNYIYVARADALAPAENAGGVSNIVLNINKGSNILTINEKGQSLDQEIVNNRFPSNIGFAKDYKLSFYTSELNKIGQLTDDSDLSITLTDTGGKTITLNINRLTGAVKVQ